MPDSSPRLLQAAPAAAVCSAANTYRYSFNGSSNVVDELCQHLQLHRDHHRRRQSGFQRRLPRQRTHHQRSQRRRPSRDHTPCSAGPPAGGRCRSAASSAARTANITSTTRTIRTTFTFPTPIRDMTVTVHDIDFAQQPVPRLAVHRRHERCGHLQAGAWSPRTAPTILAARSAAAARRSRSASTMPAASTCRIPTGRPAYRASNNTGDDAGDITISFAQPVTSVALHYGNYPLTAGENRRPASRASASPR